MTAVVHVRFRPGERDELDAAVAAYNARLRDETAMRMTRADLVHDGALAWARTRIEVLHEDDAWTWYAYAWGETIGYGGVDSDTRDRAELEGLVRRDAIGSAVWGAEEAAIEIPGLWRDQVPRGT